MISVIFDFEVAAAADALAGAAADGAVVAEAGVPVAPGVGAPTALVLAGGAPLAALQNVFSKPAGL